MEWEYTGLPDPGDVLEATGVITAEQDAQGDAIAEDLNDELLTGTPPLITGAGGTTGLVATISETSLVSAVAGTTAFLGTRRQPTGDSGSPSELVDGAVEWVTEATATTSNQLESGTGAASKWARLLEWLANHPNIVAAFLAIVLLAPVLGPAAETAANLTEDEG